MQFDLFGFGEPIKFEGLKTGDLFVMFRDSVAVLALRAEDEDSVFDVILAATSQVPNCPAAPFFMHAGALDGGPYAKLTGNLVIRPASSAPVLAVAQADLVNGSLVIDGEDKAFVYLRYQHGGGGFFVDLASGHKAIPKLPRLNFAHWQIARATKHDLYDILAEFPAAKDG